MPINTWDFNTVCLIYFIILFASLCAGWSVKKSSIDLKDGKEPVVIIKYRKILIIISYITVVLLVGMQQSNSDFESYKSLYTFDYGPTKFMFFQIEPFFKLLNRFCYLIVEEYQMVPLLVAAITYFFAYKALCYFSSKCNINLFGVVFIFLSMHMLVSFGMLRQLLAASIVFYSYRYIFERKFAKFLFYTILAFSFHASAIFSLTIYYFVSVQFNNKIFRWIMRIFVCIGVYIIAINFNLISNYLLSSSGRDYETYYLVEELGLGNLVYRLPILMTMAIFFKQIKNGPEIIRVFCLMLLFESLLVFTYYYMPIFGGRLKYFMLPTYAIIIPYIGKMIKTRWGSLEIVFSIVYGIYYITNQLLRTHWITEYLMPIKFFMWD